MTTSNQNKGLDKRVKKSPLAAELSAIGEEGVPPEYLGTVDFKVVDREIGWIAGSLLNRAGERLGKVQIEGFPIDALDLKPPGRPCLDDKHLATFLAWAMKLAEGENRGDADKSTAKQFSFLTSDGEGNAKTVRDIRSKQARRLGISLENNDWHFISEAATDGGPDESCVLFLERPTFYYSPNHGIEVLSKGATLWASCFRHSVRRTSDPIRLYAPVVSERFDIEQLRHRGPKIFTVLRPGR